MEWLTKIAEHYLAEIVADVTHNISNIVFDAEEIRCRAEALTEDVQRTLSARLDFKEKL